jgi:hypothetical protein
MRQRQVWDICVHIQHQSSVNLGRPEGYFKVWSQHHSSKPAYWGYQQLMPGLWFWKGSELNPMASAIFHLFSRNCVLGCYQKQNWCAFKNWGGTKRQVFSFLLMNCWIRCIPAMQLTDALVSPFVDEWSYAGWIGSNKFGLYWCVIAVSRLSHLGVPQGGWRRWRMLNHLVRSISWLFLCNNSVTSIDNTQLSLCLVYKRKVSYSHYSHIQSYKCIRVLCSLGSLCLSSHVRPTHSCGIMLLASSSVRPSY